MTQHPIDHEQAIDALDCLARLGDGNYRYTLEVRAYIRQLEAHIVEIESRVMWLEHEMFGELNDSEVA